MAFDMKTCSARQNILYKGCSLALSDIKNQVLNDLVSHEVIWFLLYSLTS
jgi:hypothetical protein